ncbi:MAG: hypothetical protein AAB150_16390 [Pseudomonadota bacterium]
MTRTRHTRKAQPLRSLEETGAAVQVAAYGAQREPGIRDISPQVLWRMRQFLEACWHKPKLPALLRELSWSYNLHEFYALTYVKPGNPARPG